MRIYQHISDIFTNTFFLKPLAPKLSFQCQKCFSVYEEKRM